MTYVDKFPTTIKPRPIGVMGPAYNIGARCMVLTTDGKLHQREMSPVSGGRLRDDRVVAYAYYEDTGERGEVWVIDSNGRPILE